ncbi:MarR family winged helix-turn-helix transcriptional regulator [Agaribacterium sp. ZY112]|uniref:MarR family winged helix-turn-helix transcriptional regulator n=1 Tax=Agaribacterium sp. ZY112 TaxID=3233574 RepID=UPI0035258D5F
MIDNNYIAENCKCAQLRRVTRLITRHYDEALKPCGINSGQFTLLVALELMSACSITEVAKALDMERTTLTRNLKPMLNDGLINMTSGKGRARIASLSPSGKQTLDEAKPLWKIAQDKVTEHLGEDTTNNLNLSTEKLQTALR